MTDPVSCRPATSADLAEILRLYAQPDFDGRALPLAEAERRFARMAQCPDCQLHVAERDGRIVGTFTLFILRNLGHWGTPSAVIEDVAVDPACQGQGIGRSMMHYALRRCGELGCYKAALSSNLRRERAHAFYESLGFERHGYSYRVLFERPPEVG